MSVGFATSVSRDEAGLSRRKWQEALIAGCGWIGG
jgi:hypothetical protein